jgi:hypothetical protein
MKKPVDILFIYPANKSILYTTNLQTTRSYLRSFVNKDI